MRRRPRSSMPDQDRSTASVEPSVARALEGSIVWLRGRALNIPRRPLLLGITTVLVFCASLAGLLAIPHSAARAARLIAPQPHERPDTVPLVAAVGAAREGERSTADAVASARALIERWASLPPPPAETLSTESRLQRDSLMRAAAALDQLRERAEAAPLLASYRALAESPELRSQPRVRQLLDSLTEIERAREQVGAVGGVDPVFVALTERAAEIGRHIRDQATTRLTAMRVAIERLQPPPAPQPPPPPRVDTLTLLARLDSARTDAARAGAALTQARRVHAELDERAERARAISSIGASPFAIFLAAMVLGIGFGFGVAFAAELRAPRVGTARELEWLAGAPLLAVVRDEVEDPERSRRRTDDLLPRAIQQTSDLYRTVYGRLADRAYELAPTVVVAGEPVIAAAVAANLATASARSARSTLLIDADGASIAVSALLGIAPAPGLSDLLQRRVEWTDTVSSVLVGRDRVMDVIPSGPELTHERMLALREPFTGEIEHFRRRYDTVITSMPLSVHGTVSPLAISLPQALVCARAGVTPLRTLSRMIDALREQGVVVRGVVMWDAEDPEPSPMAGTAAVALTTSAGA
jgi:hypothetical protein